MRLTLRTLLAYLDDRLLPANAKELGQKIAKSPFATELVERIREVKRRRRLAMPDKPVAMIDANLIAEYLDDQLTPELVARIEKEVLSSDAMLAEVASAHEILGLLSDPVTVEPRLRDRLYALDPTGRTDVVRVLGGETSENQKSATGDGNEWKPLPVPGESTRRVPIFIFAGMAIIWLATVISDSVLFGPEAAPLDVAVAVLNADEKELPDNDAAPGKLPVVDNDNAAIVAKSDAALKTGTKDGTGAESTTVADATPGEQPKADVPAPATAATNAVPEVASPNPVPVVATTDIPAVRVEPEKVADPAKVSSPFHLMTNNKTFFVFDETVDRWMRLDQIPGGEVVSTIRNTADCQSIFQQRWFAVPEPFSANLTAGDLGWNAMMSGSLLARLSRASDQRLEVYSGRMKLSVDDTQPWAEDRLPVFSLQTAGVSAMLALQSKDALVGIEVRPIANSLPRENKPDAAPSGATELLHLEGADFRVSMTVVTGQASVRLSGIEQEVVLTRGKGLSWLAPGSSDSAGGSSMPENVTPDDGSQIAAAPAWLHDETKPVPEAAVLDTQIKDALAKGDDPALAVIPLLSDRNPQLGVRAVHVLTATRDADRLLSALFEPVDEAVHRAAIDGLSQIANGSAAGRSAIRTALETRLPMSEVELTVSLLAGFGDAEARDPAFCQILVDLLNNDRLATRTLAFYRIQQYSNDRLGYQPEAESSRRRDAVRRWQKFLDRNGGKLLP
ncbi:MAG: hypothetical protein H7Z17_02295 [Fuerstia sp.]|nr:hypothetical protein [Fuerstiella sp.]